MAGFAHDVAGGQGNLVVTALQSPNYVAGVSGWKIAQNGDAEFNSVVIPPGTGGNTIFTQGTTPTANAAGDLWIDTASSNAIYVWSGSAWTPYQFGTAAIASGSITAALIAANTITAGQLAAGIVYAGIVNGTVIDSAQYFAYQGGSPAAGELQASISQAASTDPAGNAYVEGIAAYQEMPTGACTAVRLSSLAAGDSVDFLEAASYAGPWTIVGSFFCSTAAGMVLSGAGTPGIVLNSPVTVQSGGLTVAAGQSITSASTAGNPTLITTDTWHTVTMDSGWTNGLSGSAKLSYALGPDGTVRLTGGGQFSSNFTSQVINSGHPLPSQYWPATTKRLPGAGANASVNVSTAGVLTAVSAAAGQNMFCEAAYPLGI